MGLFKTFSFISDGSEESLEKIRYISAEMRSYGWNLVLDDCGDVVLIIGDGVGVGDCGDFSVIFRVKDVEWALKELKRMLNL